jgi:hypothetical protein
MDQMSRRSQSRGTQSHPTQRPVAALAGLALCAWGLAGCANLAFTRDTPTSGQFRSTGFSFTILSWDLPKGARLIAQENASDANLPNTVVERDTVFPYLGPVDWLLDIVGVRYAVIEGTWGFEQGGGEGPGSLPTGGFGG